MILCSHKKVFMEENIILHNLSILENKINQIIRLRSKEINRSEILEDYKDIIREITIENTKLTKQLENLKIKNNDLQRLLSETSDTISHTINLLYDIINNY